MFSLYGRFDPSFNSLKNIGDAALLNIHWAIAERPSEILSTSELRQIQKN